MEYFKGDTDEQKVFAAGEEIFNTLSTQKDLFEEGAFETAPLGDMIWESGRSPLSNAISQAIFRLSFKEIFDAFVAAGTFEGYITVFKKIFGDDVTIVFAVPAAGKLQINIEAEGVELTDFVARVIGEDGRYEYDVVSAYDTDQDEDTIAFQTIKGFQSQYELERMLREMVPGGVWTEISLTLGG